MFALAVVCDAAMDYYAFQVVHDSGYFSLHTDGWRIDIWHNLKIVKFGFIAFGMIPKPDMLILFGLINYTVHEFVYKALKRSKE